MIHGMRYSEADQILIGQAIEGGDGRSATERKMDRLSQRVAYAEAQVQTLLTEVRGLRKQVADHDKRQETENSRAASDLDRIQQQLNGLRQWVVRLVREKEAAEIETVCAWCHRHLSGPVGAAPERVSHGICVTCAEAFEPEAVTA